MLAAPLGTPDVFLARVPVLSITGIIDWLHCAGPGVGVTASVGQVGPYWTDGCLCITDLQNRNNGPTQDRPVILGAGPYSLTQRPRRCGHSQPGSTVPAQPMANRSRHDGER